MTQPNEPPAGNAPEARNPDGSLKDLSAQPPVEPAKPSEPAKPEEPKAPTGAPEKYEFKLPEGHTLDQGLLDKATPVFKELNLTQEQAQKLVDIQAGWAKTIGETAANNVAKMREEWRDSVKADPVIGPKMETVKADIGKAIGQLPPEVQTAFRDAMDFTGAGDHPAFVRAFWELSKRVIEGKPVSSGNPAPQPGAQRPTGAQAMYPHLPN